MRRLHRFWTEYARRYGGWYLLGLLCLLATNALTVAIPGFVHAAVDALDRGDGKGGALPWAAAILGGGVGLIVVRTLSRILFFNPGRTVEFRVKSAMFDHLLELPRSFFDRIKPGDIISRGTNDMNGMRALIGFASLQLFNVAFTLLLTLGRMLTLDWALTLWCVLPLAGSAGVLVVAVRRMFGLHGLQLQQVAALSDRILESYTGVALLQAFNALPGVMARFDRENDRFLELSEALLRIRTWLLPIVSVVSKVCVVIVLYVGGRQVVAGTLTLGALTAFIVYVNILANGLMSLGWLVGATQRGYLSLGRIYEVLDASVERPEPTCADLPAAPPEGYALSVQHLSWTFAGQDAAALDDVSFELRSGETVGIFGLTGAGKSTLLDLLARVYDPPPGAVRVGGVDVREVPPRAYWDHVAYVGQEPFLFSRTLRENVALADPPDAVDAARLQAAVADAALDSDIASFPEGLDTVVGERGITLSGGQRQRTALARAFYRDFELLLLDDVMSAVDHATEKRLIDALYRRAGGCSTLVVSHRISVLTRADRVLVLDGGRLVDQGTHAELAAREGPYARAWHLQRAAERIEAVAPQPVSPHTAAGEATHG